MLTLPNTPHPLQTHSEVQLPPVLRCPVVSKARNHRETVAYGRSALRAPRQQHTKARPPVCSSMPTPNPPPWTYLHQATGFFIFCFLSHGSRIPSCQHPWAVGTLACIYQFSGGSATCTLRGARKWDQKKLMPRDAHAHNLNLGLICVHVPLPLATSHYLLFPLIPLIAIHPSNYDMGEYRCVQSTFVC